MAIPRSFLSGINLSGVLQLSSSPGTSGQFLISQGAGNTPTWSSLPVATSTVVGAIELFSDTIQTTAANSVTTTASRTYGIQLNAAGQAVVNIPWTDNDGYPTAFAWTGGTTAGPTGSLTGTGMTAVSYAAIPSASVSASGIVTTAAQEFAGVKTMTSPSITTSLTTASPSFDLLNTNATTVNFAGAATTLSIGNTATGAQTVNMFTASTGASTYNFATGNTGTAVTRTINIGTGGSTGATSIINLGPANVNQTSTINLNGKPTLFSMGLAGTPVAGQLEYDGTATYSVPNTTAGRALVQTPHIYVTAGSSPDFSGATTAQSMLADGGSTTKGITLLAGTTYQFDFNLPIRYQSLGDSTTQITLGWTRTTVSGTPTTAMQSVIMYSSNTTGFTTAGTLSVFAGAATTTTNFTSPGASGSRYIVYQGKGTIRVTGSGSVKIYPSISTTAITANVPIVQADGYFKLFPVGNGTVNSVGAFA